VGRLTSRLVVPPLLPVPSPRGQPSSPLSSPSPARRGEQGVRSLSRRGLHALLEWQREAREPPVLSGQSTAVYHGMAEPRNPGLRICRSLPPFTQVCARWCRGSSKNPSGNVCSGDLRRGEGARIPELLQAADVVPLSVAAPESTVLKRPQ